MKVAFINASIQEDVPKATRNIMLAEALHASNVESIFYTPVRRKRISTMRCEGKNQIVSIFVSCWVPFFSRYKKTLENKSIIFRRIIDLLEYLIYAIRIRRRLRYDNVDAYVILHLWDSTIPLSSPILYQLRPLAVLWMGHSLRWLARFKWQYPLILVAYKLALHKSNILINDDPEQKYDVFKILKKPKRNVYFFNPCIVNEKIFYPMDKHVCAKRVGFSKTNINILNMSRITSLKSIASNKDWDYEKNIFLVIEVFRWVVKENPNIHLHIVGDGPGMNELRSKIKQYSLQDKVTLYGSVPPTNDENDIRPYFINAADLIINPSCLIEFNIEQALFEALMCSKPVIAFKRYGWVATEHLGGFLIDKDPKVAAEQILSRLNPDYLEKKSREARMVPIRHGVPMELWGNKLSKIMTEMLRG